MTQATATTAPNAVRQHGGGLIHANQPRATLRGRHQSPSGGVINRRCAAASIIALASSASATLAYPKTCVRQAQKSSTPLRSPIRPPAQLVVGYGPPIATSTTSWRLSRKPFSNAPNDFFIERNFGANATQFLTLRPCEISASRVNATAKVIFQKRKVIYQGLIRQISKSNGLEQLPLPLHRIYCLKKAGVLCHCFTMTSKHVDLLNPHRPSSRDFGNGLDYNSFLTPFRLLLTSLLATSNKHGDENTCDSSESLNPSRSTSSPPRQVVKTKDQQCCKRRNQPELWPKLEINSDFIGQHARLLGSLNPASLTAHSHHVQRGAA